jgi:peptidoglycan/xylan/chitin deacetylase (PgdA/CDA1 family)
LSFDDGAEPIQTELILKLLERYKISASFFMIGEKAKRHANLVQEVLKSGRHLVGNHSWSHPNFHTIAVQEQAHQVNAARAVLVNASEPKLFRYP